MEKMYMSSSDNMVLAAAPAIASHLLFTPKVDKGRTHTKLRHVRMFAANSGGFSLNSQKNNSRTQATRCDCQILNGCKTCGGKGAIECPGCKGTGKNKKNGNIFERWKCFDCQGFGLKSCPNCGRGGLTPEQRGER